MAFSLQHKKWPPSFGLLIPFLNFEEELFRELILSQSIVFDRQKHFAITENLQRKPIWARDYWPHCTLFKFTGKSEAIKFLKSQSCIGVYFETGFNPKMAAGLRQELRELKLKRIQYQVPSRFSFKYFAWALLDEQHLIFCPAPSSQFPLGWHEFNEDKSVPPNRAYLKIWEILCLNYIQLQPQDQVLDLGASPGGWSWALSEQVTAVYAIDKAPLSKPIAKKANIYSRSEDAFSVKPQDYSHCNWLFSDIICTPERLLKLIQDWHQFSQIKNYVCTIKFKGPCNFDMLREFRQFPDSTIIHLYQNKNEVTWIKQVKAK